MQSKNRIILNRSYRVLIFSVFLLVNTGINTSGGLIASASTAIKTQLQMNNKQFGLFGTIFGVGRVSGSLLFMLLINKFNRKYIMGIVFLCKSFILMSFKTTNVPWMLVGLRGINGICHMFPVIYTPVWIDQFGIQKYRMIFMTILQVFIPAGKVLGYFLNMILGEENVSNIYIYTCINVLCYGYSGKMVFYLKVFSFYSHRCLYSPHLISSSHRRLLLLKIVIKPNMLK